MILKHTFHKAKQNLLFLHYKIYIIFTLTLLGTICIACISNTSTNTSINSTSQGTAISKGDAIPQAATMGTTKTYPVKIYFSKSPESYDNFGAVFPVDRISPTSGGAVFAIQQLIAGPTASERNSGYFSELSKMMSGSSTCPSSGDADFALTMSEQRTATLRFCRTLASPGVGADARVQSEINATLKQFASIKKVIILTTDGHCFGDESGRDLCLH